MNAKSIINALLWGGFFIVGGVLWLLSNFKVIDLNLGDWWPIIFIIIGINIIVDAIFKKGKK